VTVTQIQVFEMRGMKRQVLLYRHIQSEATRQIDMRNVRTVLGHCGHSDDRRSGLSAFLSLFAVGRGPWVGQQVQSGTDNFLESGAPGGYGGEADVGDEFGSTDIYGGQRVTIIAYAAKSGV